MSDKRTIRKTIELENGDCSPITKVIEELRQIKKRLTGQGINSDDIRIEYEIFYDCVVSRVVYEELETDLAYEDRLKREKEKILKQYEAISKKKKELGL